MTTVSLHVFPPGGADSGVFVRFSINSFSFYRRCISIECCSLLAFMNVIMEMLAMFFQTEFLFRVFSFLLLLWMLFERDKFRLKLASIGEKCHEHPSVNPAERRSHGIVDLSKLPLQAAAGSKNLSQFNYSLKTNAIMR